MILNYDSITLDKINELKRIKNEFGGALEVYELIKIYWTKDAAGNAGDAITYCCTGDADSNLPAEIPSAEVRLTADFPNLFKKIPLNSALSDDEIDVEFLDADDVFSNLFYHNGEGTKVEVFLWCPQVELLLNIFQGHLRPAENADLYFWRGTIANGFRSPDMRCPGRGHYKTECQAIFGGELETQAEIDENDCPYNRHISGGTIGNLDGSVPFTTCNKTKAHCIARLGDTLSHLSHDTIEETTFNGQTSGGNLYPQAIGNETNLTQAVRVVMGQRWVYELLPMALIKQFNNNHPDEGYVRGLFGDLEGEIGGWSSIKVNDSWISPIQFSLRNGNLRQSQVPNFSANVHNYSGTAYFQAVYGPCNPADFDNSNLRGSAYVRGLLIKTFASADIEDFTKAVSNTRSWQIIEMLTNKRWSYGQDITRIGIQSFYECGVWGDKYVRFTDPDGTHWDHYRAISNVELTERELGQQIDDMCLAGHFSRPFIWNGKLHMLPLRALTDEELAECPVFTTDLDNPNVLVEEVDGVEMPTIKYSQKSDKVLPNRIEVSFDNSQNSNKSEKFSVNDFALQKKAGRLFGDKSVRKVTKNYTLLGVTEKPQAAKSAWRILDLGPFDEGGVKNNLELVFRADWLDCLTLHVYKVIKFENAKINNFGFDYFKIKKLERQEDLSVEITTQAHNNEYLRNLETEIEPPPPGGGDDDGGGTGCRLQFGSISYDANTGTIIIPIDPCEV